MMDQKQVCPNCNGKCVKNGKSHRGEQRYYCKNCKKYHQVTYQYKACNRNSSQWIVSLTKENCGVRSISRLLNISLATVMRRVRVLKKLIARPFVITSGQEYEVDEMRTYIGNKKRLYWVVYALRKDTREVVDFKVGKRNTKTLQSVIDTLVLSGAKKIYTDGYELYKTIIPKYIHKVSKYNINYVERKNLSIRTHLKRLSRKTICFSRSKEMLEACLRIYFWSDTSYRMING